MLKTTLRSSAALTVPPLRVTVRVPDPRRRVAVIRRAVRDALIAAGVGPLAHVDVVAGRVNVAVQWAPDTIPSFTSPSYVVTITAKVVYTTLLAIAALPAADNILGGGE